MIEGFLISLRKSTTLNNIRSGFRSSGIFPLDPSAPLSNNEISPGTQNEILSTFQGEAMELTSEDSLQQLAIKTIQKNPNYSDCISIDQLVQYLNHNNLKKGIHLSKIPDIYFEDETITRIKIE